MTDEAPTCAKCKFGQVFTQDITKRLCKGAPPQVVLMPTPQGIQLQFHFPIVDAVMNACALYKMKTLIDTPEGTA